jgi:hypothetical protein
MATGRIRRSARHGIVAIVLGWLAILVGSVLLAPSASADPAARVDIRDLTPPLVSVDAGGKVTFANAIQDKTVQVGGGGLLPSLVSVVVHTDVALGLPSGAHPLQQGQEWTETFPSSCVGCTITYTYRVTVPDSSIVGSVLNTVTSQAVAAMPQSQVVTYNGKQTTVSIGVPTPFIVNTLVPLPNLPSVNLPRLPQVNVPNAAPVPAPAPRGTTGRTATQTITTTTTTTTVRGIGGTPYAYDVPGAVPKMAPVGSSAASAFDPARLLSAGAGSGSSAGGATGGAGGRAGTRDSASLPTLGLDGTGLADAAARRPAASSSGPALPVPAVVALVALAGVAVALVRTRRAARGRR